MATMASHGRHFLCQPLNSHMLIIDLFETTQLPEGIFGRSVVRLARQLAARGWEATTVPNEYRNAQAPGYSIDLDPHGYEAGGPFVVFRGNRKLGRYPYPPYASHLALQ
jgi:hypothetical protein